MAKNLYVNCPFCEGMMEVNAETGQIINKWARDAGEQEGGDKMSSALKKIEDAKKKRSSLFDQTKQALESQKKKSEESFQQEVERLKKEGIKEKPFRPFDLD